MGHRVSGNGGLGQLWDTERGSGKTPVITRLVLDPAFYPLLFFAPSLFRVVGL